MCFPFGSLLLAMFHNNSCVQALEKLCATICSHQLAQIRHVIQVKPDLHLRLHRVKQMQLQAH